MRHIDDPIEKNKPVRSEAHRRFIASLPCLVTKREGETQCAHIRDGVYAMGMKPSDVYCVPLSCAEHQKQHEVGEKNYWADIEKVKEIAEKLWEVSGDHEKALEIINDYMPGVIWY